MGATAHINFIAAAYAAAVIVVGALVAWVTFDYRALRRAVAELEMLGLSRRSGPSRAESAPRRANEAAEQAAEEA